MKNPCYNCDKRNEICHSVCKDYKVFRDENSRVREKARAESVADSYTEERHSRIKNKAIKKDSCYRRLRNR